MDTFLKNPLNYCNNNTSDLFLVAMRKSYREGLTVIQSDKNKFYIRDQNASSELTLCTF